MADLCFSEFAKCLKVGLGSDTYDKIVVESLLDWLCDQNSVIMQNNDEIVDLPASLISNLLHRKANVPPPIRKVCNTAEIVEDAMYHFKDEVIPKLNPQLRFDMYKKILDTINSDKIISDEKKNELITLYKSGKEAEFLGSLLIYVICRENILPKEKIDNKKTESGKIERKGDKLIVGSKTIQIHKAQVPKDINEIKLKYKEELDKAFAQEFDTFLLDGISSLPPYAAENYRDQHINYFSAVEIEEKIRDVYDDEENEFVILKEELFESIKETYLEDEKKNGYKRLKDVMKIIPTVSLDFSVLCKLIRIKEKKGICHMLVEDGVIKSWVNINE